MNYPKKIVINVALVLIALAGLSVDHYVVASTEALVIASCDTRVAYDKSGSMFCMNTPKKSVKLAQK